jgi:N-hydroxyarylamine O-acetyltransferase
MEILDAYLHRIGLPDAGAPSIDNLRRLHSAHATAIPFENLDILLGRGIRLDLASLYDKLIAQRRGGYCFEQNTLFMTVLREIGFTVVPMEARVRAGARTTLPRTHMVLQVDAGGEPWLADVGFGALGPREPVPTLREEPAAPPGLAYRVVQDGSLRVLQMREQMVWSDQYAFLPQPVEPIDFEVANWYTSTWPDSPFVRTLTAQRSTDDVRYVLRFPVFTEIGSTGIRTRDISRAELMPLLREVFLIDLPDDTAFAAIDRATPAAV